MHPLVAEATAAFGPGQRHCIAEGAGGQVWVTDWAFDGPERIEAVWTGLLAFVAAHREAPPVHLQWGHRGDASAAEPPVQLQVTWDFSVPHPDGSAPFAREKSRNESAWESSRVIAFLGARSSAIFHLTAPFSEASAAFAAWERDLVTALSHPLYDRHWRMPHIHPGSGHPSAHWSQGRYRRKDWEPGGVRALPPEDESASGIALCSFLGAGARRGGHPAESTEQEVTMGTWGPGPFDNDHALDLVGRLLDGGAPGRTLRRSWRAVQHDGYVDVDDASEARAGISLLALVVTGAPGLDRTSNRYEAAARLRPTAALIKDALAAIPRILAADSELAELLPDDDRKAVDAELTELAGVLRSALAGPLRKLPKPTHRTTEATAFPVGTPARWMVFAKMKHGVAVLDKAWDVVPKASDLAGVPVLVRCAVWVPERQDAAVTALGRVPLDPCWGPPFEVVEEVGCAPTATVTLDSFVHCLIWRGGRSHEGVHHTRAQHLLRFRHLHLPQLQRDLQHYLATGDLDAFRARTPQERFRAHRLRNHKHIYSTLGGAQGWCRLWTLPWNLPTPSDLSRAIAELADPPPLDTVYCPRDTLLWTVVAYLSQLASPDPVESLSSDAQAALGQLDHTVHASEVHGALQVLAYLTPPPMEDTAAAPQLAALRELGLSLRTRLGNRCQVL